MKVNIPKLKMILEMNEEELYLYLYETFTKYQERGKKVITDPIESNFIYIEGDYPVLVVAHLDTFLNGEYIDFDNNLYDYFNLEKESDESPQYKKDSKPIYFDQDERIMWSPVGLGADDRAGVYLILELISHGCWPHILFTTGEESGGRGAFLASILLEKEIKNSNIKYFLQLDRRGENDAVFYNCKNEEFKQYITSFGWKEVQGIFSDISILSPELNMAGVNVSIGYRDEHSLQETLSLFTLEKNYDIIYSMIKRSKTINKFEYFTEGDLKWL